MLDIRDKLFSDIAGIVYEAALTAEGNGVISGARDATEAVSSVGATLDLYIADGEEVSAGEVIGTVRGNPKQIAMSEELLIGSLAKTSGIASAARHAVRLADGGARIISGAWKKMPPRLKDAVRHAVSDGGASFRICEPPMLYLDKNFIRMFGSIERALRAGDAFPDATRIVQLHGICGDVEDETIAAFHGGCDIFMVDTGRVEDVRICIETLRTLGKKEHMKIAFAGDIRLSDIPALCREGIDLLDVGREIVDAPLLDMKLDVTKAV